MLIGNSTEFLTLDSSDSLAVVVRIFLVISACVLSTIGNIFLITIFVASVRENRSRVSSSCRVIDMIIVCLAIASFCRGLLLGPIQASCFVKGEWTLGDSICQLQGFMDATLRNVIIWYIGLLSIERYTKHITPHDYLVTFSPLTINIIFPGIFFIVVVQVTGPLYGWGKYDYLQGSGLCTAAVASTFSCSYGLYILFCLTMPPMSAIIVNGILLTLRLHKVMTTGITKKCAQTACSRIFTEKNELLSLIVLISIFLILSSPRSVTDISLMCQWTEPIDYNITFTIYFLDSLTNLLLPITCVVLNQNSRKLFLGIFLKNHSSSENLDMSRMSS